MSLCLYEHIYSRRNNLVEHFVFTIVNCYRLFGNTHAIWRKTRRGYGRHRQEK